MCKNILVTSKWGNSKQDVKSYNTCWFNYINIKIILHGQKY